MTHQLLGIGLFLLNMDSRRMKSPTMPVLDCPCVDADRESANSRGLPIETSHRWHHEFRAGADAGRPAGRDRLEFGVEAYAFRPMHMVIAEERSFPATKRMDRHGNRDRHVEPAQPDMNLVGKYS